MTQTVDTDRCGNTKTQRIRQRCYMITIFNDDLKHFDNARYECWCDDSCKDGKHHIHQVIYFKSPISFNTIKKAYPTAHIEFTRDVYQAIHYIKDNKNGRKYNVQEIGEEPKNTRFMTAGELRKIPCGDDVPDWKMYNTWQKMQSEPKKIKLNEYKKNVKVYYIQGPSNAGKSEMAENLISLNEFDEFDEVKHTNNFWNGVSDGCGACIYDDFRDDHMKPAEFINFIDYRVHNLNVKNGCVKNKYNLIIITSVQRMETLWKNSRSYEEAKEQWLRRVEIIDMYKDDDEDDVDKYC